MMTASGDYPWNNSPQNDTDLNGNRVHSPGK